MTAEADNVAKLKEAYRRWDESRASSIDSWLDLLADNVDFRSLADGAQGLEFTGRCCSKAEVGRYFIGLAAGWEMIHYTPDEFIAQGDRVVMLGSCSWKNRRTGEVLETPKADFWRFKDGKAVSFFEFYDTAQAISATQAQQIHEPDSTTREHRAPGGAGGGEPGRAAVGRSGAPG